MPNIKVKDYLRHDVKMRPVYEIITCKPDTALKPINYVEWTI